jgi:hypothetical protein
MPVKNEFWVKYILNRFWKENEFLKHAFSEDEYVIGGAIVHLPQPGSPPTIVKNRSSFPATAVRRTDTDITYVLDEYTTDPTHIQDAEKKELSYAKIDSVFLDHVNGLSETVADDLIIKWASTASSTIIRTTGGYTAALVNGQIGTRKVMVDTDLQQAKLAMNLQNVPKKDRFALLEDNMADQLCTALGSTGYKDFSVFADPVEGTIGKLHGFKILTRSSVAMSSNADAVNALGAEVAEDDNITSLLWQKDCVARAMGNVQLFQRQDDPLYYGDIYSALIRMGGRVRRPAGTGVIRLVQGV